MQSTDLGRIASHYYVSYHSLATYNEHLRVTMGDIELLRLFALSDEFRFMVVRGPLLEQGSCRQPLIALAAVHATAVVWRTHALMCQVELGCHPWCQQHLGRCSVQ